RDLGRGAGALPVVDARHGGRAGDVRLLVAARRVQRGTRHRGLGPLVAPARRARLLLVAAGQFGARTAARRQLRPTAALGAVAAPLGRLAPAAGGVLALRPGRARGLQSLRGARRRTAAAETGAR